MASAGIPGMAGFIAEILVLQGSYATFPLPTRGTGLTVYFVILLNRTCFGKLDNDTAYYPKSNFPSKSQLVCLATIFFLGIQPTWLVRWSETTTNAMVAAVQVNSEHNVMQVLPEPEAEASSS